jgi:hypothetical protein
MTYTFIIKNEKAVRNKRFRIIIGNTENACTYVILNQKWVNVKIEVRFRSSLHYINFLPGAANGLHPLQGFVIVADVPLVRGHGVDLALVRDPQAPQNNSSPDSTDSDQSANDDTSDDGDDEAGAGDDNPSDEDGVNHDGVPAQIAMWSRDRTNVYIEKKEKRICVRIFFEIATFWVFTVYDSIIYPINKDPLLDRILKPSGRNRE